MAPWGSENDSGEEEVEVAEWWVVLQPGAEPESQRARNRLGGHLGTWLVKEVLTHLEYAFASLLHAWLPPDVGLCQSKLL